MNWNFKYFERDNFACKCGCGFDNIDYELVGNLDILRGGLGISLIVISGCRCKKHNKIVGGKDNSAHLWGKASDIKMPSNYWKYKALEFIYENGLFKRIGIYPSHIHVDISKILPQPRLWIGGYK